VRGRWSERTGCSSFVVSPVDLVLVPTTNDLVLEADGVGTWEFHSSRDPLVPSQ